MKRQGRKSASSPAEPLRNQMPSVVVRPQASDNLAELWAYIAEDSPRQADAFAVRLRPGVSGLLARNPNIGRARPELLANLRSFPIGRYIIFYLPRLTRH